MSLQQTKSLFRYYGHTLWPQEVPLENAAFKLLEHLTLKVTPPAAFNDPFEFTPVLDRPVSRDEARMRLHEAISAGNRKQGLPQSLADALTDVVLKLKQGANDPRDLAQRSALDCLSEKYGVVCFSESDSEPLMWAHYAAQHHGLMVEFDPSCPLFSSPGFVQVDYQVERVRISAPRSDGFQETIALAKRKSPAWAYEREHRLVVPLDQTIKRSTAKGDIYLLKIDPAWIKSITVGLRASFEIKGEVNKLARRADLAHLHSNRYRMHMDSETFQLRREKVTHF